jgi:NADPH2:quinone reductase
MKALLCVEHGPPEKLELREVPSPEPGPDEVLIEVKACGVNFPDTLIIRDLYQFKPRLPFSPGSDVAGVVKAVGEDVSNYSPGDEVLTLINWGGFAEEALADAAQVFPKPAGMDFETAAAFLMAYATSYHALKDRAQLQKGESLVVLGAAGGVGLTAVELGKLMGARVIAAASTKEKLDLCREYGADETINYVEEDLKSRIKELTDGAGADVVYDPVGGDFSEAALRATAWKGRFLVIGFAAGEIPKIPLNLVLLKGCQVVGVFWGRFAKTEADRNIANTMQLVQWYAEGKIKPHIDRVYSLEDAPQALRDMMERRVKGKVVVRP